MRSAEAIMMKSSIVCAVLGAAVACDGGSGWQGGRSAALSSPETVGSASGGGTVLAAPTFPTTIASFGFNARRSGGFTATATGRINYDKHGDVAGRHVN